MIFNFLNFREWNCFRTIDFVIIIFNYVLQLRLVKLILRWKFAIECQWFFSFCWNYILLIKIWISRWSWSSNWLQTVLLLYFFWIFWNEIIYFSDIFFWLNRHFCQLTYSFCFKNYSNIHFIALMMCVQSVFSIYIKIDSVYFHLCLCYSDTFFD